VLWTLRDLVLQTAVNIFVVIMYKIYYTDKIPMWYFIYWVSNIIIKLIFVLAGRSAVDIWWWPFGSWGVLGLVNVDSQWWQWHLNRNRLSFLCQCRNIILLIRYGGEFSFIVCGLSYLLCCDLYKEIKMAAFYIYIYIYSNSVKTLRRLVVVRQHIVRCIGCVSYVEVLYWYFTSLA
jgi:hypothetical protein